LSGFKSGSAEFGSVGQAFGAKTVTLTEAQLASHNHSQNPHNHLLQSGASAIVLNTYATPSLGDHAMTGYTGTNGGTTVWGYLQDATASNNPAGGGQAHSNIQPSRSALLVIKT
jgi:microcystin-dependent protein